MRKIRRGKGGPAIAAAPATSTGKRKLSAKGIWALGIIGVMVFSAIGFYYADRQDLAPGYNGYRFKLGANNEYLLRWNKQLLSFTYHPTELTYLALDPQIIAMLKSTPQVLITIDTNSTELSTLDTVRFRLGERFTEQLGISVGMGITAARPEYPLPIITCANATTYVPVISMQIGEPGGIRAAQNCIVITGTGAELRPLGERLEYNLLGVMD